MIWYGIRVGVRDIERDRGRKYGIRDMNMWQMIYICIWGKGNRYEYMVENMDMGEGIHRNRKGLGIGVMVGDIERSRDNENFLLIIDLKK